MFGYIVRRLIAGVLVLIAVSMMVFAIFFYGPNDPALAYCPESRCTPERLENIRHNLGLDRPAPEQYVEYMSGLVKGRHIESGGISIDCDWPCLGVSFKYRVVGVRLPLGPFPGDVLGRRGRRGVLPGHRLVQRHLRRPKTRHGRRQGDREHQPVHQRHPLLPAGPAGLPLPRPGLRRSSPRPATSRRSRKGPSKFVGGMLLPWIMIGIAYSTQYARFSRGAMIDALNEDYVRTRAGQGPGRARHRPQARAACRDRAGRHDLRPRLRRPAGRARSSPRRSSASRASGWPALDAVQRTDLPMISASTLISAAFIVIANIVVDVLYSVIDPRVRLS